VQPRLRGPAVDEQAGGAQRRADVHERHPELGPALAAARPGESQVDAVAEHGDDVRAGQRAEPEAGVVEPGLARRLRVAVLSELRERRDDDVHVEFYDAAWNEIWSKASLCEEIALVTEIDPLVLRGATPGRRVLQRTSWAASHSTSRLEDVACCWVCSTLTCQCCTAKEPVPFGFKKRHSSNGSYY
jgi:hypothetical protein